MMKLVLVDGFNDLLTQIQLRTSALSKANKEMEAVAVEAQRHNKKLSRPTSPNPAFWRGLVMRSVPP
jgi:hypothetical protein